MMVKMFAVASLRENQKQEFYQQWCLRVKQVMSWARLLLDTQPRLQEEKQKWDMRETKLFCFFSYDRSVVIEEELSTPEEKVQSCDQSL